MNSEVHDAPLEVLVVSGSDVETSVVFLISKEPTCIRVVCVKQPNALLSGLISTMALPSKRVLDVLSAEDCSKLEALSEVWKKRGFTASLSQRCLSNNPQTLYRTRFRKP